VNDRDRERLDLQRQIQNIELEMLELDAILDHLEE
jgi:hypothetical protein